MSVLAQIVVCIRRALALGIGLACLFLVNANLAAQDKGGPDPTVTPNLKLKPQTTAVVNDLRDKNFNSLDYSQFAAFFTDYYLLQLVDPKVDPRADPKADLTYFRNQLKIRFLGAGKSGTPFTRLTDLTFEMMKAIVRGKFPVNVKYSAMLMIGELNEAEDANGKSRPLAKALDFMLKAVEGPRVPDYLRVPALIGIQRHAEDHATHPIPSEQRAALVRAMVELVGQQAPPPNRSAEAQNWLRRQGAQVLGGLGEPGLDGGSEVIKVLIAAMRDPKNALSVRCAAAQALGELRLSGGGEKVDVVGLCWELVALAVTVCKKEAAWAQAEETYANRRRLTSCLLNVRFGIWGSDGKHGLAASVPDSQRDAVDNKIKPNFGKLWKLLDKDKLKADDLLDKDGAVGTLEKLARESGKVNAVAAPATPAPPPTAELPKRAAAPTPTAVEPKLLKADDARAQAGPPPETE